MKGCAFTLIEMVEAACVQRRRTTFYAVHEVSSIEQEFCKICTILTRNAGNQSHSFWHGGVAQYFADLDGLLAQRVKHTRASFCRDSEREGALAGALRKVGRSGLLSRRQHHVHRRLKHLAGRVPRRTQFRSRQGSRAERKINDR
jgi:hypothetical protein